MNYSEFSKLLKTNDMGGAYLLHGNEEYIKELCIAAVIDRFVSPGVKDINYDKIDASEGDMSQIENAMIPLPFMSEKRVVAVYALEILGLAATKLKQAQYKNDIDRLADIIKKCPKETVLLLVSREPSASSMVKLFSPENRDVEFKQPSDSQKIQYLKRMAKQSELKISDNLLRLLVQYTGMSLLELDLEMKKLKAYVKDGEVVEEDIFSICPAATEYSIFKMLKHITNKEGGHALAEYRKLMLSGQSPQAVTAMIARQFRSLFYIKELNGLNAADLKQAAGKLRTKDFVVKNMNRIASRLEQNRIDEIVKWCADADYMVKSGKISVDSSAEMLIMRLIAI